MYLWKEMNDKSLFIFSVTHGLTTTSICVNVIILTAYLLYLGIYFTYLIFQRRKKGDIEK